MPFPRPDYGTLCGIPPKRPEGIAAGALKLVGSDKEVIYENFKRLLEDEGEYAKMSTASNPYGDGFACKRIADILEGKMYVYHQRNRACIQG